MPTIEGSEKVADSSVESPSNAGKVQRIAFTLVVIAIVAMNLVFTPAGVLTAAVTGWYQNLGVHQVHDMAVAAVLWTTLFVPLVFVLYRPKERVNAT